MRAREPVAVCPASARRDPRLDWEFRNTTGTVFGFGLIGVLALGGGGLAINTHPTVPPEFHRGSRLVQAPSCSASLLVTAVHISSQYCSYSSQSSCRHARSSFI